VSTEEFFALWRSIGEVSKDALIGVRLGTETSIARFHLMGIAALSTESLGAAIDHMARYKRLSAPEEILHETTEDEWAIQFRWSLAVDVEPVVLVEHCFAWVLTIARQGTGTKIKPLRVELLECVGTQESMMQAIHCTCPGGSIGYVGVPHGVRLDAQQLFFKLVHLHGGPAPVRPYLPKLIELVWSQKINPGKVFDLTLPLNQVAEGYRAMDERRAIKALLQP
jgi:hypothetical protein